MLEFQDVKAIADIDRARRHLADLQCIRRLFHLLQFQAALFDPARLDHLDVIFFDLFDQPPSLVVTANAIVVFVPGHFCKIVTSLGALQNLLGDLQGCIPPALLFGADENGPEAHA